MKGSAFVLLLLGISSLASAQKITMYSASGSAGIQNMCFDEAGNRYITGYYSGRPYFTTILPDASKASYYMAKMTPDNKFVWVKSIDDDKNRWQMSVQDNALCVIASYSKKNYETDTYLGYLTLEKYDLNGEIVSSSEMASTGNSDVWLSGYADENGIIIAATVKGDKNSFTLRGKTYTKKRYSAVVIFKFDYNENLIWEYKIEGGFNGFTDLRINDIVIDKQGNTYVGSYYSQSADLGIASYTTKMAFHGPIDLYNTGCFLLKIDNTGKAVLAKSIADYEFNLEKLLVDDHQNVYLSAYYKGSDAYEKANPSEGNYKAAWLLGSPLPDTRSKGEGITAPSEDHVYAKLDKDFNLLWKQFTSSDHYARARDMELVRDTLHICGNSGGITKSGSKQIALVGDGYGDTFYSATNALTGEVLKLTGHTAENSNIGSMYADKKGNIILNSAFRNPVTIDGKIYQTVGSITTSYIYEFSASPKPSEPVVDDPGQSTVTSESNFKVGDHVRCDWKGYGKYYACVIAKIDGDKILVKYNSDNSEEWTTAQYIKMAERGVYHVGDEVEGNWKGGGTWYPGKIGKIEGDKYYILYDDGDVEWTTVERIRRQ